MRNQKNKVVYLSLVSLITLLTATIAIGNVKTNKLQTNTNDLLNNKQRSIKSFIPKELPIKINRMSLVANEQNQRVLKFYVTNSTLEKLSEINFLVLTVDNKGRVKAGQGWRVNKNVDGLAASEITKTLKYPGNSEDRLVLTSISTSGKSSIGTLKNYSTESRKLFKQLADAKLIKNKAKYSKKENDAKTKVSFLKISYNEVVKLDICTVRQNQANLACDCGVKSFNCNPQTGAYSYTCFSEQEVPSCESGGDS